jgi:diguanylate cyclase (GGDEF)-like protein
MIQEDDDDLPASLVIVYTKEEGLLGRCYKLPLSTMELTVGRRKGSTIELSRDGVSRRHARFEMRKGRWWVVDLDSTNGLYVEGDLVKEALLRVGDKVTIGGTVLKVVSHYHEWIDDRHFVSSPIDGLTKTHSKRYFMEQLRIELARVRPPDLRLTMVLIDLDHFKRVNDTWGHLTGDHLLREIGLLGKTHTPPGATFARYGGEEFAWLLPGTDLPAATALAEGFRAAVEARAFTFDGHTIPMTISAGVAQATGTPCTPEDLILATHEKLHAAKREGRNRVMG